MNEILAAANAAVVAVWAEVHFRPSNLRFRWNSLSRRARWLELHPI
jgi:hypothetical protein